MSTTQTIERTTLTNLIYNEDYTRKVLPFIKAEYFANRNERVVFEEIEKMSCWATRVEKCPAVCPVCGSDAYYTFKKVDGEEEILVGGSDIYEPRCWNHHPHFSRKQNA